MKPFPLLPAIFASLLLPGCGDAVKEAQVAEKATSEAKTGITLPKSPLKGQELNAFFPKDLGDLTLTFTQEKPGFSQADVKDPSGTVGATISISDLVTNPEALAKFAGATAKVKDYPMVASGDHGTSILVGNQFQVQVHCQTATEEDRRLMLEAFDLEGLAKKSQAQGTLGQP